MIFKKNYDEIMGNMSSDLTSGLKPKIPLLGSASKSNSKNTNDHLNNSNSKNKNHYVPQYVISSFKQFKDLCYMLGISIEIDFLNSFYEEFNRKHGITIINFEKFKELLREILARIEVLDLYLINCEEEEKDIDFYSPYMSNIQLQEFFRSEQSQMIKLEDINEIIKKSYYTMNSINNMVSFSMIKNQNLNDSLSFLSFCKILFSENNYIFSHEKSLVYQDMDRPLTDYYINGMRYCFSQDANPYNKLQSFESFLYKILDKGSRHLEFLLTVNNFI